MTDREMLLCIVAMLIAMLAVVSILLVARPAHGSAVCLTKHEARQLWPKKHLYWYSKDHCWSNRRGGPPTGVKYDLIRDNHAQAIGTAETARTAGHGQTGRISPPVPTPSSRAVIKIVPADQYNEIDAMADRDLFFDAKPIPFWRFSALDDGWDTWHRRIDGLLK